MNTEFVYARWPVSKSIKALTTTRIGGVSGGIFRSLNLATHVGDDPDAVTINRRLAANALNLPGQPVWLRQVHGSRIVSADCYSPGEEADGSYTDSAGTVCTILTADCLPLFICNVDGSRAGVFHVGWKGLAAGIVADAARLFADGKQSVAWLGPAIGPDAFEIGADVKAKLEDTVSNADRDCFVPTKSGKWLANLYALAAAELDSVGIPCHYDDSLCTFSDGDRFFSYRRSGECGRMASFIWLDPGQQ